MKKNHLLRIILVTFLYFSINSCSTLFNLPAESQKSTLGEITPYTRELMNLPYPKEKIVIGVYKFKDQTGQYKMQDNGSSWSTAIPQGTTSILLKSLEDSKWFRPIERENIGDLLNERQIIRSTRKEYKVATDGKTSLDDQLPPLLYAGILLEGGIISYDSNVMTGGIGMRYFGISANTQYRQDRVTVYLRVVSSMTGEILKTVYTSKNILYTTINGGFFRYVDADRLLESEVGITQNEPVSLAVTQAIEKAVYSLIIEGVKDGLWYGEDKSTAQFQNLIQRHEEEIDNNFNKQIGEKFPKAYRNGMSFFGMANADQIKDDYADAKTNLGGKIGLKYFIGNSFNVEFNANYSRFQNTDILDKDFAGSEINLEYLFLPKYKLSPYVYAGFGGLFGSQNIFYKTQFGGGLEYMLKENLGLRLNSQFDLGMSDNWDDYTNGKYKDQAFRIGLGFNYYFGKTKN